MLKFLASFFSFFQILFALFGFGSMPKPEQPYTAYPNVLVHGLGGWGEYDTVNFAMPYWGMTTGNLLKDIRGQGYECYAASVGPISSAWDRACELYAQLTGTVVDYGAAHSLECGHERFGRSYAPLLENWSSERKINLFGHSFGGATVRLFTQIACEGVQAEIDATGEETSAFFKGGLRDCIYSVTTLAAPHNGSTASAIVDEGDSSGTGYLQYALMAGIIGNIPRVNGIYDFQLEQFGITAVPGAKKLNTAKISEIKSFSESKDNAGYDLSVFGAHMLNEKIKTQEGIYYYSYACCLTEDDGKGNQIPLDTMQDFFLDISANMGKKKEPFTTSFGLTIDDSWLPNDGIVNTISAVRPFAETGVDFDENNIPSGIWNLMPVLAQDHTFFMGGITSGNSKELREFYLSHLQIIDSTIE